MQPKKPITGSPTNAVIKSKAPTGGTSTAKTTTTHTDASHQPVKHSEVVGKAVEKKPVETDKKPVGIEKKPVEKKPVEKKPVEKKPVETDKKPVDIEKKPVEAVKRGSIGGSHDKKDVAQKPDAKKGSVVGTHGTKEGAEAKGDVKKPAASSEKKHVASEGAHGKAVKGSHAEEKHKSEQPEVKVQPMPVHEIKLPAVELLCKEIVKRNKTPMILDKTGNYFTFLKYKGNVCDFQEFEIKKGMGKTSREDFLEVIRTRLVSAMKVGNTCALFIDKGLNNLGEFFKGVGFFKVPESLIPERIKNEKYFKENVLKPEEDVDGFGNKGGFRLHEDFILSVVANGDDEEKLKQNLGLPLEYFELVKISE